MESYKLETVYGRILKRFESGEFKYGKVSKIPTYYMNDAISDIPLRYRDKYDKNDYLVAICESIVIDILEEYDTTYEIALPEDWCVTQENCYLRHIMNEAGEPVITYFYDASRKKELCKGNLRFFR